MTVTKLHTRSTPYTYILEWTQQGKRYIGARWAVGCHPSDLWNSYFTSSEYVADFVKAHGKPDIILIDKTFDNAMDAMTREQELQYQFDVRNNDSFLNKSVSGVWDNCDPEIRKKMSDSAKGRKASPELKAWYSEFHSTRKRSIETGRRISAAKIGHEVSDKTKEKLRNVRLGTNHSDETKQKMSDAHAGTSNHFFGKNHSEETRKRMSEFQKNRTHQKQTIVACQHCGKEGGKGTMPRWHFDNCKHKQGA